MKSKVFRLGERFGITSPTRSDDAADVVTETTDVVTETTEVAENATEVEADATEVAENATDVEESGEAEDYQSVIEELTERLRLAEEERAARERELLSLELLSSLGLPRELSPLLTAPGVDMESAADIIHRAVSEAVAAAVTERCRSDAPGRGGSRGLTSEEIRRTPVSELQRLRDIGGIL